MPGATVSLVNKGTGLVQTAVTSGTGTYTFTNVQAGVYDVKVSNQDGRLIALFRGKSHRVGGMVAEVAA